MPSTNAAFLKGVKEYYSGKLEEHGTTSRGVDWSTPESQRLRFEQLERIIAPGESFSLLDYGCGFGSLYSFLSDRHRAFGYTGFDIAGKMIEAAVRLHPAPNAAWLNKPGELRPVDYTVASGVFNVKLGRGARAWEAYIKDTLGLFHELSRRGFAFNLLTSYSDKDKMKDYLYYADPAFWFDYCKKHFSKHVALLHDYPLYEFTILVRRASI